MATFNWPGFGIASVSWTFDQPAQVNRSSYTGVRAVASNPWHGKWSAKVQLATKQGDGAFQATRAFFTGLLGTINNFHLPAVEAPQNANTGVTLSANAAQGAVSLALTGVTTALVAGNMVTIAGQLLSITGVGSLSGSAQTINFMPALRAAASSGASVETAKPYALVALTDSSFSWDIAQWRQYGLSFTVDEDVGGADGASPSGDTWNATFSSGGGSSGPVLLGVAVETNGGTAAQITTLNFAGGASVSVAGSTATIDVGAFVTPQQFGALGNGSTNDYAAINSAIATGLPVRLPATAANQYNFGTGLALTGNATFITDPGVVLHYTGSTGAALSISGQKNRVELGEINAPSAPYCVRYFNLQWSRIEIRRPGSCTTACIWHDAGSQTANEGNNRWVVGDIQAGSVPYGIKLDSHATFTVENDTFDVNDILSATTCSLVIGTAGNNTLRWNRYNVGIDAQGITPMLIDVYNDANDIYLSDWAALVSPPIADIRFNTGTLSNKLVADPGIQGMPIVSDLGTNTYSIAGVNGERIEGGTRGFSATNAAGVTPAWIENRDSSNVTTKSVQLNLKGRDTINSGKNVGALAAVPQDGNWTNGTLTLYSRIGDALVGIAFFGINGSPNSQITAPVGAIATRRDGGTTTTLYVKESGTGNTGWVAK